ncbi:Ulp1 family isopeptidase [Sphingomonas sp. NCPPB 2930]
MDNFFNGGIGRYRRVAESHPDQGDPAPPEGRSGHAPRPASMPPAIEGLPPRRTLPGLRDGPDNTMGPPVPSAESMSKSHYLDTYKSLIAIMPRYSRGEDYASLRASFPKITSFLTAMGGICENPAASYFLNELDQENMDYIRHHIGRRIEKEHDKEFRALMHADLRRTFDKVLMQPERVSISSDQKIIENIMRLIPRYANGESMQSLKEEMPTFGGYLAENSYSGGAGGRKLWPKFTKKQQMEISEAVKSRQAFYRLSSSLDNIRPKRLLDIAIKFGDQARDLSEVCSLAHVTEDRLSKYVDLKTGNLTMEGEKIISETNESFQKSIRWYFKARFRHGTAPAGKPGGKPGGKPAGKRARPVKPEDTFPGASFFSGVSEQWRAMGHGAGPATPRPPAPSHDSMFDGLSSFDKGGLRAFDLNTPGEVEQPWRAATPPRPAPSHDSMFDGLSSLDAGGYRAFDLNTPGEVEQPWPAGMPMASPERIVVDALPSPAVTEGTGLPGLTADAFLGDEHLFAYLGALGRDLAGRPHAGLLNFADPQQVNLLLSGDSRQRRSVLRRLAAPDTPPIVFLPINDPNRHWSLLVIDRRTREAFHYDSMVPPERAGDATRTFQYAEAHRAARALGIDAPVRGMPIAQQRDGYSCGDHVLEGIAVLAHRVVDGTFGDPGGMDLRHIQPDRARIADVMAGFQAHGGTPAIPGAQGHRPDDPDEDRKQKRSRF